MEPRSSRTVKLDSTSVSGPTAFQVGRDLSAPFTVLYTHQEPHTTPRWRMTAREPRRKRPRLSARSISEAIASNAREGNLEELDTAVRLARHSNIELNSVNYTALAAGLARGGAFRKCFETLASMREMNLIPTNATLRMATSACLSWAASKEAARAAATLALQEMVQWFIDAGEPRAEVKSWNMVMAAFVKLGARRRMHAVLRDMERLGGDAQNVPKPDVVSYNTCMAAMKGNVRLSILLFLVLIRSKDLSPDVTTYNTLLRMAIEDEQFLISIVEPKGTAKERVVIGSVFFAKAVLKSMQRQNVEPDLKTWTVVLRLLTRTQSETAEIATLVSDAVAEVWSFLKKSRSSPPDLILCNALISAFARVGNTHATAEVLQGMQARNISADIYTINSILAVLSRKGEVDVILQVLEELRGLPAKLDKYTYVEALSACSRCTPTRPKTAELLLESAIRDGVGWEPAMVNAAISSFGDRISDALEFWQRLRSTSLKDCQSAVKNVQVYEALLRVCGRAGRPDVALRIAYVMRKSKDVKSSSGVNLFHSFERGVKEGNKQGAVNGLLARRYVEHFRTECRAFEMNLPIERIRIKY